MRGFAEPKMQDGEISSQSSHACNPASKKTCCRRKIDACRMDTFASLVTVPKTSLQPKICKCDHFSFLRNAQAGRNGRMAHYWQCPIPFKKLTSTKDSQSDVERVAHSSKRSKKQLRWNNKTIDLTIHQNGKGHVRRKCRALQSLSSKLSSILIE